MTEPSFVVLPVSGDGGSQPDQQTAEIASTVQHALYQRSHPQQEHPGPFKQMLAHPDSLYKYINWEDPVRTGGLYLGGITILSLAHFLPLTQLALKAGLTTLGVVSVTEFASRSLSGNSLSARLRPTEYRKIPEPALDATLKDVHDFIQYATVEVQKIVFGQDLDKTFAAFLGFTALYLVTGMLSPFWFAMMALTSVFVAPLVTSPQGRRVAHDASVRAQELANVATEKSRVLAQSGMEKATELSSKGRQTAADLSSKGQQTASNLASKGQETAANVSSKTQQTAANLSSGTQQTASNLSSKTQQTASGLSSKTQQVASDLTSKGQQTAAYMSNRASETTQRMTPGGNTGNQTASGHGQNTASSMPTQHGGKRQDSVTDTGFHYTAVGDADAAHGMMDRPRGVPQAPMEGA